MQTFLTIVSILAAVLFAVLLVSWSRGFMRRSSLVGAINTNPANWGTHHGRKSYLADAAITQRYSLVKIGSDADHSALCTAAGVPIGVCTDEIATADLAVPVAVELLGLSDRTLPMVANGAINANVEVYAAASAKVSVLSATPGTYYKVGRTLTAAAADGDVVEVQHCYPVAVVVT